MPAQPSEPGEEAEPPGTEGGNEDQEKHAVAPGGRDRGTDRGPGGDHASDIGIDNERALDPAPAHHISQAGGGSSPVLPILVAVAVLAALSIGAVLYRQRRHTPVD